MPSPIARLARPALLAFAALLVAAACGSEDAAPAPTATPEEGRRPTAVPTLPAGEPRPTGEPDPTEEPTGWAPSERSRGEVAGVVFTVSEGSRATFTVREELTNVSLPFDAVIEANRLSGEVRLDGGPSHVTIDLHGMTSDQEGRDRYIRNRMFPNDPSATITFGDLTPLPAGFVDGKPITTQVPGTLRIKGVDVPLTFDVEARDDGAAVHALGRTEFTWDQLGLPVPSARVVVSLADTVRTEVLLALEPERR